jgi:SHNi-TPR
VHFSGSSTWDVCVSSESSSGTPSRPLLTPAKEETESIGPSTAKESKDVNAIEAEEEEDPSNLQLAWEMIELAKVIYTKHLETLGADSSNRTQFETRLSDTYETLGEVSIENENYNQAIEDLTTSLKMRQKLLPEDSRLMAETHYQLGVALGFNSQFS